MITGMLWFDNSPTALAVKIQRAADYYSKKYGRQPDLCLVNPSMMEKDEKGQFRPIEITGMTVHPYHYVLSGHIWIGVDVSADIEQVKVVNKARS